MSELHEKNFGRVQVGKKETEEKTRFDRNRWTANFSDKTEWEKNVRENRKSA